MDCSTARVILMEAADLVRLTTMFKAQYGKDYRLAEDSPADAWTQQKRILEHQRHIAELLDAESLPNACPKLGRWWERHDVLDSAIAHELLKQAGYLIAYCGHMEVSDTQSSHILHSTQCVMAGMLHPQSREVAVERIAV